jgi:hypothetical protein
MAGHWAAVALLVVAGLGFAVSLIIRPPADGRAAAWRLALGLAVMFTLAPATRWGYFVYPIGLVGWMVLTRAPAATDQGATDQGAAGRGTADQGAAPPSVKVPAQAGSRA